MVIVPGQRQEHKVKDKSALSPETNHFILPRQFKIDKRCVPKKSLEIFVVVVPKQGLLIIKL